MVDYILKMSQEQHRVVTIMYQGEKEITQRNICVFSLEDDENVKALCT